MYYKKYVHLVFSFVGNVSPVCMIMSNKKKRTRHGGNGVVRKIRKPNLHRLRDQEGT